MIICLIAVVILFLVLLYNDMRQDLKDVVDLNTVKMYFMEDKIIQIINSHNDCPELEIEVFSHFVRVKFPKKHEKEDGSYYSTFFDAYEDVNIRKDRNVALNDREADMMTKLIFERCKTDFPNANVDYGKKCVKIEFYV